MKPTFKQFSTIIAGDLSEEKLQEIFGVFSSASKKDAALKKAADIKARYDAAKAEAEKRRQQPTRAAQTTNKPQPGSRGQDDRSQAGARRALNQWVSGMSESVGDLDADALEVLHQVANGELSAFAVADHPRSEAEHAAAVKLRELIDSAKEKHHADGPADLEELNELVLDELHSCLKVQHHE